jgi:hypothetical protein
MTIAWEVGNDCMGSGVGNDEINHNKINPLINPLRDNCPIFHQFVTPHLLRGLLPME